MNSTDYFSMNNTKKMLSFIIILSNEFSVGNVILLAVEQFVTLQTVFIWVF